MAKAKQTKSETEEVAGPSTPVRPAPSQQAHVLKSSGPNPLTSPGMEMSVMVGIAGLVLAGAALVMRVMTAITYNSGELESMSTQRNLAMFNELALAAGTVGIALLLMAIVMTLNRK